MLKVAAKARAFIQSRAVSWAGTAKPGKSPNRKLLASSLGRAMAGRGLSAQVIRAAKMRPATGFKRALSSKKNNMKNKHIFTRRNKRVPRRLRKLSKKMATTHK